MSLNFFDTNCCEPIRTDRLFGLCDTDEEQIAFTNVTDKNLWIANVENDNQREITFTAIDGCVIKSGDKKGIARCDAMLTALDQIFLVELKDQKKGRNWRQDGKKQLEDSIRLLTENHDVSEFKKRKAFICNKRNPLFESIENSTKRAFFEANHRFRLHIENRIVVR